MNILIVTPLPKELEFFLQPCLQRGLHAEHTALGRLPIVQLPDLGLTLVRGGAGKAQFAVHTQHLLDQRADWDLVVCAGAAGALAEGVAVGDVVVATTTVEHDYRNRFTVRPPPRFEGAAAALGDLRRAAPAGATFGVHFGTVASGDEDVIEDERKAAIFAATGALAVAWEGAGGARACAFSGVPYLEVRGVTDGADHTAPADFEANLGLAMGNVAELIMAWIGWRTA
jgi:adenosylhomocysteine nucleosidase